MSLETIHLRNALRLLSADARHQRSLLLRDIREDRAKEDRDREGGGDFYGPFWADVKGHIGGNSDIGDQVETRVAANRGRARLYPLLATSFLSMWTEKMRWRNEPYEFVPKNVKARLIIPELEVTLKIENTIAIRTQDGSSRIIYPYFSERPALRGEDARIGLALLSEALPDFAAGDFRLVDILRQSYFMPAEVGMTGAERDEFVRRYRAVLVQWRTLGGGE